MRFIDDYYYYEFDENFSVHLIHIYNPLKIESSACVNCITDSVFDNII